MTPEDVTSISDDLDVEERCLRGMAILDAMLLSLNLTLCSSQDCDLWLEPAELYHDEPPETNIVKTTH
jgi:hypothetical protein